MLNKTTSTATNSVTSTVDSPSGTAHSATGTVRARGRVSTPKSRWAAGVITWTVQLAALCLIIGLLLRPVAPTFVADVSALFAFFSLPSFPTLLTTAYTVVVASGILRGHRGALLLYLLTLQVPSIISGVLTPVLWWEPGYTSDPWLIAWTIVPFVFAVFFFVIGLIALPEFPARIHGQWLIALAILLGSLLVSAVATWLLITTFVHVNGKDVIDSALAIAFGVSERQAQVGQSLIPGWIQIVGEVISAVGFIVALAALLRSRRVQATTPAEHMLIRRLLLQPVSEDSLGYFATNYDRNAVASPDGKAAVTYRVVDGVALAAGDPIGEKQSWPQAIAAWREHARTHGWIMGAASVSEEGARAYAESGMRVISLGDEAVIATDTFRLKELADVRHAIAGPKRAGYTVEVRRQAAIPPAELQELAALANRWRRGSERGFTMASGRVGDPRDQRTVLVVARDADGTPQGLLSFVPWGRAGLSLDVMRRSPHAHGGVTELMVAELAAQAGNLGVAQFSLNFVPARDAFSRGDRVDATPWQRLMIKLLTFTSRWWQIRSLYVSNLKYQPRWQPRYLCFDSGFFATRVTMSFAAAEGFLPDFSPEPQPVGDPAEVNALEAELLARAPEPPRLPEPRRARLRSHDAATHAGVVTYPPRVPRTLSIRDLGHRDEPTGEFSITGRILRLRRHGGVIFADVAEQHHQVQVLCERSAMADAGPGSFKAFLRHATRGDIISITGHMGASRTGTPSVVASSWAMAAKSLVPLPKAPLTHPHQRAKFRHIDFALNSTSYHLFEARAKAVAAVRQELYSQDYLEAETPILQIIHGGANARPFNTHIRAYDQDLYLRIAPELYLKRLVVGGFPRVFEIGRNFRNEGVDATHNPEFTALEAYEAYGDWDTMRELTQKLITVAARAIHGTATITVPGLDGKPVTLDLEQPWPVVPVYEAVSKAVGETISPDRPLADYAHIAARFGIDAANTGDLVTELYDELVESTTVFPTFYTHFPVETSPLTMADPQQPLVAQRWDLVGLGMELGTAYTELADPIEQRKRLTEQSLLAAGGDPEAMEIDDAFLDALAFGMPPTGGLGIGVDRLIMFLTGTQIRDVLAFPFVKPDNA